ncbi:MAG: hypothetical protein A2Y15_04830 [Clostridiales bacterium GWF2_36_10]|nr:MAG: hypothetical protein A2Y15_04830 [Clostridiales bacterium GWF2_36_10]
MINAFYSAKSGSKNYQTYLDAIGNNIANVNTASFKAQNVSFTDLLYTNIEGPDGAEQNLQTGNGSRILITRDMSQGTSINGSSGLDVMIKGDGFFALQGEDGNISYSRISNFTISDIGGTKYLTNKNGDYVLNENLEKIEITSGEIAFIAPSEVNNNAITLGVFRFDNPEELVALSDGKFGISAGSTLTAKLDTESSLLMNMIESSNVDLASEMAKMIIAQRGFQVNAKMIQTVDEMEQYANNLRN